MIKIEIIANEKQDGEFTCKGGATLDYLSILSETIVSICKNEGWPVEVAVKGLFHELGETELDNSTIVSKIEDLPLRGDKVKVENKIQKVVHKIYVDFVLAFRNCYWHKFEGHYKYDLHFLGRLHDSFDSLLDEGWENETRLEMIKTYIHVVQSELNGSLRITSYLSSQYKNQIEDIATELFPNDLEIWKCIEK